MTEAWICDAEERVDTNSEDILACVLPIHPEDPDAHHFVKFKSEEFAR